MAETGNNINATKGKEVIHGYEIPTWAGKPSSSGLHLDVNKEGKLLQKLMVDEKKVYFFGRNPNLCDFCIDHSSCSRVHAALVFHKVLQRFFLVDMGSTHGTFIGKKRLEPNCPTQLLPGVEFSFGASTRTYILRERPGGQQSSDGNSMSAANSASCDAPLPEDEIELDHLTEYNTANNKRISMIGISDFVVKKPSTVKKRKSVVFREEEEVINPEDIDPSVGKFRNLVQSSVIIPSTSSGLSTSKRFKTIQPGTDSSMEPEAHFSKPDHGSTSTLTSPFLNPLISNSVSLRLGIDLPNPAPDLEVEESPGLYDDIQESQTPMITGHSIDEATGQKKKKYAKEHWPGRSSSLGSAS